MLKIFGLIFATTQVFASLAFAIIYTPYGTYVVTQNLKFPHNVQLFELDSSKAILRHIQTPPMPYQLKQVALLGAAQTTAPTLVGISDKTDSLYILDPTFSHPTKIGLKAVAVSEMDKDHLIVGTVDNDIFSLDGSFNETKYIDSSLLPKHTYGSIVRMQFLGIDSLAVLTQTHLLIIDVQTNRPVLLKAHDLRQSTFQNWKFSKAVDLVARPSGAWILMLMHDSPQPTHVLEQPLYLDLHTGQTSTQASGLHSAIAAGNGFNHLQFLDMDSNQNLIFKFDDDYLVKTINGYQPSSHLKYFAPSTLVTMGMPASLGTALHVTVEHHRSALYWMPRAANLNRLQLHAGPSVTRGAVASHSTPAVISSPISTPVIAHTTRVVKDYETLSDFLELIKRESINFNDTTGSMKVEKFVESVNTSELQIIRYYFQTLEPSELASLGIKRQGTWLLPMADCGDKSVTRTEIARLLAMGRAREIAACKKGLGEP